MRRPGLTAAALLAAVAFARPFAAAQAPLPPAGQPGGRIPTPGAAPGFPPGEAAQLDPKMLAYLNGWEATMQNATNFYAETQVSRKNNKTKQESLYAGNVRCLKPNLALVRLNPQSPGQPPRANEFTLYICDGRAVFEYEALAKTVTEYRLQNGVGVGDNLLLEFMSGTLKARDLIQRFDLKLAQEDANYVYLEIGARMPKDQAEFRTMTLVLHQPGIPGRAHLGYLPRTVVIRKWNGESEERWDFPNPVVNAQGITPADFRPYQLKDLPKDWKYQLGKGPDGPAPGGGAGRPNARP